MALGWDYYPLSVFGEALRSVVGRVVGFFLACWCGAGLAFAGTTALPPDEQWLEVALPVVGVPLAWFWTIFVGLMQGWGFVVYPVLLLLGAVLLYADVRLPHIYLAVFVVQAAETVRLLVSLGTFIAWGWLLIGLAVALVLYGLALLFSHRLNADVIAPAEGGQTDLLGKLGPGHYRSSAPGVDHKSESR